MLQVECVLRTVFPTLAPTAFCISGLDIRHNIKGHCRVLISPSNLYYPLEAAVVMYSQDYGHY